MKKLFITAMVIASVSSITSCKKVYSCECVTTVDISGVTETTTEVIELTEKMKEKQAESACNQSEDQMNSLNDELVADTDNVSYDDLNTTCSLK
jgi:hypothetical protein